MTRSPIWLALAAALAALLALAIPAAAGATVAPPQVQGNELTVTSDEDGDTIVLTAAGGQLVVNGTPTTLKADANAEIHVVGAGGADSVDASALLATNYDTLTLDGGSGNDTLTGGAGDDLLHGEAGNDRLLGFKGKDEVLGGEGDDAMVWNNGDGSDINDGEAGSDEVEVNGSTTAGDSFVFKPDPVDPGRVQFDRLNLVEFGIELSAERLTVNGLGGEDLIEPDPDVPTGMARLTAVTINGGIGDDSLIGGDGGDQISGGPGNDSISGADGGDVISGGDELDSILGEGGADRIAGDRGSDEAVGGEGDDTLVWNNGDGSDENDGGPGFDRVEVNGSPTGGDVFRLSPNGATALFERKNLVPFTITLAPAMPLAAAEPNGGIEAVSVNGGGGDDNLTVAPGLPGMLVSADGGSGNDELSGAEEADSFFGGSGDDVVAPGGGSDLADGQDGSDTLLSRDGVGDLVRGGTGTDSAITDAITVDAVEGVESLTSTPLPSTVGGDTVALLPKLGKVAIARTGGKLVARVPLFCPAGEAGGCRTTLTLETAHPARLGAVNAVLVLGSKSVKLRGGQKLTATVRIAAGAAGVAKHGKLAARLRIASADAAGNSATRSVALGLRFPGA
jgi:Ca2+-binding RTX toxin-like protein